jgi:hypothetical protein
VPKLSYVYPNHMQIFNFFEVQNIHSKNKRNFHIRIFVRPLYIFITVKNTIRIFTAGKTSDSNKSRDGGQFCPGESIQIT